MREKARINNILLAKLIHFLGKTKHHAENGGRLSAGDTAAVPGDVR